MAHPNEDLIRRGYEAFGTGDFATLREMYAEDAVWHVPGRGPLSGEHRGRDAILAAFAQLAEITGGTLRAEVHDVLANDEHGVALHKTHAERGGRSFDDNVVQVFHFRDGKVSEAWLHPFDEVGGDEFFS